MRIGLTTCVLQRGQSGVGQYILALTRALLEKRGEHHLTLFVLAEDLPRFEFAARQAELVPVPESYRPPLANILWHQFRLPALARRRQLQVLHVPSYRRLLWQQPCALVATIHDLAPFTCPGKYDWKRTLYGRRVVPRLARRQHEVIAVSEFTACQIRAHLAVPDSSLTVIHNGLDHWRFHPGSVTTAREQAGDRHGLRAPFFLYVARLEHPAKNHVRLIAAFNRFKQETGSPWLLALAGSDWHGAPAIHAAIQQSPYARDIRSLGFVPDVSLPGLYRAASVFVYPSLFEGFGIPPLEAMACGCPVLCSTRGGLAEVVGEAAATVDPDNTEALAFQLRRLASEPATRRRLAADGLARARTFDWANSASATLGVYARARARTQTSSAFSPVSAARHPQRPAVSPLGNG